MTQTPQRLPRRRSMAFGLAAVLALAAPTLLALPKADSGAATIAKKQKKITGTLSKGGYTVIALAKNGDARTDRAPNGEFALRPPAKKVSLHLRASNGSYAGPIVVGTKKSGERAILGVYAGAKLGKVKVKSADGYAKVKLAKKWVDAEREARAKKGVPIGAGNFGRVKSKKTKGGAPGDFDLDGVANPLDIDDDGDLILDNIDHATKTAARASAQASGDSELASGDFGVKTLVGQELPQTVNANAGLTDEQIAPTLPDTAFTFIEILPGDSAELDCGKPQSNTDPGLGGLVYCTKGGTGEIYDDPEEAPLPFPECCDSDNDGFGTLVPSPGHSSPLMTLFPRATSDQIGSGDVLIQRVTTGATETPFVATLPYVFATTPALISYDDGQGNSVEVNYPVPGGGPGTENNPFPVKAGPGGDVVLELTFWRPQRRPVSPETADWIDIGGLDHAASLDTQDSGVATCERDAYSTSDPNLALITDPDFESGNASGFTDLSADRPVDPEQPLANTLTYQLNMTECMESKGNSFNAGQTQGLTFAAYAAPDPGRGADRASTLVYFEHE